MESRHHNKELDIESLSVLPQKRESYLHLGDAFYSSAQYERSVDVFKRGLAHFPGDSELEVGLKSARLAVLDSILDYDDIHNEKASTMTNFYRNENSLGAFLATVDGIAEKLTMQRLIRIATLHLVVELSKMWSVVLCISAFGLSMICHAVMHRNKIMLLSMIIVCVSFSALKFKVRSAMKTWISTSSDKISDISRIPFLVTILVRSIQTYGHIKLMAFLAQDSVLSFVTGAPIAIIYIVSSFRESVKKWADRKKLKVIIYFQAVTYWVLIQGHTEDLLRLLSPALIDIGSTALQTMSSEDLRNCCRRALQHTIVETHAIIEEDVDIDAWFILGLMSWFVDYWQQPTNISFEVLGRTLVETFQGMRHKIFSTFGPEMDRLKRQLRTMQFDDDLVILIIYLKQTIHGTPPGQLSAIGCLTLHQFPSLFSIVVVACLQRRLSYTAIALSLFELHAARNWWKLVQDGHDRKIDGYDILFWNTSVGNVWGKIKSLVDQLDTAVCLTRSVQSSLAVVQTASRVSSLVRTIARLRRTGSVADFDKVSKVLVDAWILTQDSCSTINHIKQLCSTDQIKSIQEQLVRWYRDS